MMYKSQFKKKKYPYDWICDYKSLSFLLLEVEIIMWTSSPTSPMQTDMISTSF